MSVYFLLDDYAPFLTTHFLILFVLFNISFLKNLKCYIWWRYMDDISLIWEHGEEPLKLFLEKINSIHPTLKFTAD